MLGLGVGLALSLELGAVGPPTEPPASAPVATPDPGPTWHGDIAELVRHRCGACHRADGAGPFELLDHQDVASRGRFILQLVDAGRMPPWLPSGSGWRDDRRLTPAEASRLRSWVEAGAPRGERPEGEETSIPTPQREFPRLVRSMTESFEIAPESDPAWHRGVVDQRGTAIPLGNPTPWRVRSISMETNAPQAVRLASLAFDDTGAGRYLDERDPRVGFLMSADAGLTPSGAHGIVLAGPDRLRWPRGFHQVIPPGADAVVEWHYRPTGKVEQVRPRLGFELVPEGETSRPVHWLPVGVGRVQVPAETVQRIRTEPVEIPVDADLVGVTPRALEITRSLRLLAIPPEGTAEQVRTVLEVEDWDHHQRETWIAEPIRSLPKGTRVFAEFVLDNRSANPANPDVPAVEVRRGRRTGILSLMLHLAAVDAAEDPVLRWAGVEVVKGLRGRGAVQVTEDDDQSAGPSD